MTGMGKKDSSSIKHRTLEVVVVVVTILSTSSISSSVVVVVVNKGRKKDQQSNSTSKSTWQTCTMDVLYKLPLIGKWSVLNVMEPEPKAVKIYTLARHVMVKGSESFDNKSCPDSSQMLK